MQQTLSLTTGADTITGTANNDSIVALATTLNVGDNIAGGTGTDTMTFSHVLTGATTVSGFSTSSVEKVAVSLTEGNAASHTITFDMLNSSTDVLSVSGNSTTTASDILALTNLSKNTKIHMNGSSNIEVNATYSSTTGTSDSVTLEVSGVVSTAAADSDVDIASGIETVNIITSGSSSKLGDLNFGGSKLVVTGDQSLTIADALEDLATIDASGMTAALSVSTTTDAAPDTTVGGVDVVDHTITLGSGNDTLVSNEAADNEISIDMGAGDDTLTLGGNVGGATSTNAGDTIKGGEGRDTLKYTSAGFNAATTTANAGVSGFERIMLTDALANNIVAANVQATGIDTVSIPGGGAASITMAAGTNNTVEISSSLTGALTVVDTGTATTDAITLKNSATAADDMGDANNIVVTGYETLNIDSSNKGATESQDFGTITITADTGGSTTANFSGTNRVTTGAITAATIDASGLSAQSTGTTFSMGAAAVGVTTITGSAGADTLVGDTASTIHGGAGNDSITGGSGNDTLNGDDGNDTITTNDGNDTVAGGAGNDTLVFAGPLSALDNIDGGEGTDTLSLINASITALQALTISEANTFNSHFAGIERLLLTDTLDSTGDSFDLGYLNGLTHVKLAAVNGAQTIAGFDSGDTLELTVTLGAAVTPTLNNAKTGAADVLNVSLINTTGAADDFGDLTLANIETINITTSEATANTADRGATIGLTITQTTVASGGSGAAQTVNITGTESLTVDAAIAAGTINASGMTISASTNSGLIMGAALTATTAIPGQTITGSGGVDTLRGSTGASTINAGAGNDTVYGNATADTIDGGTGTDTFVFSSADVAEQAGASTTSGTVINLGATTLTAAAVQSASGLYLSQGSTVATNTATYLFNGDNSTNASIVDTLINIENATGTNLVDYIVGSDSANVLNGAAGNDVISAGAGDDTITGGAGDDTITLGTGNDKIIISGNTSALNGADTISTFNTGDVFDFSVMTSGALANATSGTAITLATTTALATEGTSIAVADEKVYIAEVASKADIDTAAEVIAALDDEGVLDAVDFAANADAYFIVGGADDDTTHYIYAVNNDGTAAVATGELVLIATVTTDITNGIAGLLTTNYDFGV